MKRPLLILSASLMGDTTPLFGQDVQEENPVTLSGYVEAYYIKDFNDPPDSRRPGFVYSHNRTDDIAINMALVEIDYDAERLRAGLGVAAGTYMKANYAAEPGALRNLFEANVGLRVRLDSRREICRHGEIELFCEERVLPRQEWRDRKG